MAAINRFFNLAIPLVLVCACFITSAQTPGAKPKGTASISGRVTIGEKPAPGVTVIAFPSGSIQSLLGKTVSDAEGTYRLDGLPPGQVTVAAATPAYVAAAPVVRRIGRLINLSADENVDGVDFKLIRGSVITGRVSDADGKPVIDEHVSLSPVDEKAGNLSQPPNPYIYNTDDRGIYRIYGLPAGRYKVSVGDEGRMATLRAGYYQRTYFGDTTDEAKAAIVELSEGGESKNIDINVTRRSATYAVSGRMVDAKTNQPVAGIDYSFGAIQRSENQQYVAGTYSNNNPTNAKGEFRLEGIAPGRYAVTASANSFSARPAAAQVYSDPAIVEVTDSDVTGVEIKVQRSLSISGTVIPDGITNKTALAAIPRLLVAGYLEPSSSGEIHIYGNYPTAAIAPDGTFQLDNLQPGRLNLSIGYSSDVIPGVSLNGYSISRVVTDHELPNRQLELSPGQNVSGMRIYVIYGSGVLKGEVKVEGGMLPADVSIYVWVQRSNQPQRVASASVDVRGHFIVSDIPAGSYDAVLEITSNTPNGLPPKFPRQYRQPFSVSNDTESQITFTLTIPPREGP